MPEHGGERLDQVVARGADDEGGAALVLVAMDLVEHLRVDAGQDPREHRRRHPLDVPLGHLGEDLLGDVEHRVGLLVRGAAKTVAEVVPAPLGELAARDEAALVGDPARRPCRTSRPSVSCRGRRRLLRAWSEPGPRRSRTSAVDLHEDRVALAAARADRGAAEAAAAALAARAPARRRCGRPTRRSDGRGRWRRRSRSPCPRRSRASASELIATEANASLISQRSTSPGFLPIFSSACIAAFAGVLAR